jgi:hypothetical protein
MSNKSSLATLVGQYQRLCQYCDDLFAATFHTFRLHIKCAKGCASCCILETVTSLEASMISSYLESSEWASIPPAFDPAASTSTQCVFLHQNLCLIYPVRPIICRTHGLPILYPEQGIDTCPLNFSEIDLTSIDPKFLLDADRITQNLMRLNLAFCLIMHQPDIAGDRIPLQHIITRQFSLGNRSTEIVSCLNVCPFPLSG